MDDFSKSLVFSTPTIEELKEAAKNYRKNSGQGCESCNYTGFISKATGSFMCSCIKEKIFHDLFVKADIPKKYLGKQIHDWNTRTDDLGNDLGLLQSTSENIAKLMQSYERNFYNICSGNPPKLIHSINVRTNLSNICFYGLNGSGKTFIASVMVQTAIRKNLTAKYYDWTDLLQLLTDFDKKKDLDDMAEEFKNYDFICIDGIENFNYSNPYLSMQLDRLCKARINSGKPYMLFGTGDIEKISTSSGWQSLISNCLSIRLPHAIKKS